MASGSKFSMSAVLSLVDNMTNPYKKTTSKITALNRSLGGSFGTLNRSIDKVAMGVGRGLRNAAVVGVGALSAGVVIATKEFISLDASITQAGAKFKDLDSTSKTYQDTLKQLSSSAREVGRVTEFSATDAAGALDKFAMAGIESSQAMALLMETTNLATSAGTDLTTAVDIVTDSLGAFGQMTSDTVLLGQRMTKMSDQMAKTTTTANTSLIDLFEAVGKGARTFTDAGQSMATFNSFAGVMANATIKGGEAGTALRNVMLKLSKPTAEAQKVLSGLGVTTADANGDFRDIVDIIADFEKGLKGMGTAERTAALATVFGSRTVNGFNVLLGEGSDALRKYRDDIINSEGASRTMADAIRNSLGNRLKVLKSGLTELGLKFIDAFDEKGRKALDRIIEAVGKFDMNIVIDAVNKTIETFKSLGNFIMENKGFIEGLIITLAAFKTAILLVNGVMVIQSLFMSGGALAAIFGYIGALISLIGTEGLLATAQMTLNTAMSANPIGLIILAVTAIIVLFVKLVKHTGGVKEAFQAIGSFFVMMGKGIMTGLEIAGRAIMSLLFKPINLVIESIKWLLTLVSKIPGVGDTMKPAIDLLNSIQGGAASLTLKGGREKNETERQEQIEAGQQQKASLNDIENEKRQRQQESTQRNDIFLHAPSGAGISDTAGGAPSTAVNIGKQ